MNSPFEAQALIQGVSIVSLASAGRGRMLLLDQPAIDHRPADECAPARAHMGNRRKARNFPCKKVGKVRAGNTEIIGCRLDVHYLGARICPAIRGHAEIPPVRTCGISLTGCLRPNQTSADQIRIARACERSTLQISKSSDTQSNSHTESITQDCFSSKP